MSKENKLKDQLPESFADYQAAAEFWDNHDTMDYPEAFADVAEPLAVNIIHRHFEIEVDEELATVLRQEAKKQGVSVQHLVGQLLRKQLSAA